MAWPVVRFRVGLCVFHLKCSVEKLECVQNVMTISCFEPHKDIRIVS